MVVRVTMDFFQHRYYRLNKILMTLIGQWPYQSSRVRRGIIAGSIVISPGQLVPQILALVKYRDDRRIVLDCVIPALYVGVYATKLTSLIWNSQKTLKLLNRIRTDWQVWARDREVNVLHEYAEQGEKIKIVYTAVIYSNLFVFVTEPVVPKVIDVLLKNGTEPGKFPYPVDYYHLDAQKYYWYLITYCYVCACMAVTLSTASDVMFITYVQHVCGIFTALGNKLQRIGNNYTSVQRGESSLALEKRDLVDLAACIDRHNDAIEYAALIDASYSWTFFCIIGLGMIMINVTGLQVLMTASDPEETLRFMALAFTVTVYFYLECYISQVLMDRSVSIRFYIHNSQWYRLSVKAQKLLQFVTMRSSVPCRLTAGNFFVMSVRTFGQTFRTTLSYFAYVRSARGL